MSSAGPGRREVAHRIFAAEYDDATLEYAESDEERAPNYVVTPSGTRINRLFVVGVLTAVEQVNDDTVRARIADPTGAFVVYAGQYQPDELAALQSLEAPAFVAVTGKANTFSPEGSDRVLTSVRPESVTEVDAETRDRWVTATAEHTLARIQTTADALAKDERGEALRAALLRDGVEPGFAEGIARALDHYDTTADYLGALRDLAIQSLEVVAGERSEVEALELDPDAGDGTVTAADLADLLGEDRRAVMRAAGDVDVDALVGEDDGAETNESEPESTESVEEEPADGAAADQEPAGEEPPGQETADADPSETVATTGDEAAESSSDDAEAQPAEDDESTSGPEPETSEAAVAETAAEAEEAADAKESEAEGPGDEESGAAEATSEPEPETSETAAEETAEDAERAANDEIYEFDEEEREQIEEEHGVEFQSGTEVDPAGEADIEAEDTPPGADESGESAAEEGDALESDADEGPDADGGSDAEDDTDATGEEGASDDDEASEDADDDADADVDLEAVLVEEMDALDDGDGADREALIDAVAGETGANAEAIDEAIDDLLMSGQCYEPSEGTLKPI